MHTVVSCQSLFQVIFPTQKSNTGLPHCRWILHPLNHQGSPTTSWLESNSLTHRPHGQKSNLSKLCVWTSYPSVKYPLGFLIALEVKFKLELFVRFSRSLFSSLVSSLIIHHLIIYALTGQSYLKFLRLSPQNCWTRICILTWSLDESPAH